MQILPVKVRMSKHEMDIASYLLEKTQTLAKDCYIDSSNDKIIFLISKGDLGRVIGQRGETINNLRRDLKREIDAVEYSENLEKFVSNLFYPVRPVKVAIREQKHKDADSTAVVEVYVGQEDMGRAIGKQGAFLQRVRSILNRYYSGISNVKVLASPGPPVPKIGAEIPPAPQVELSGESDSAKDPRLETKDPQTSQNVSPFADRAKTES